MKQEEYITAFAAKQYNPMTLAYLGDAVYELLVREYLTLSGNLPVGMMHERALAFVSAGAQSAVFEQILPMLSEEEAAIYRRGRNAKSSPGRRNIDLMEYKRSTGLEALFGYLHLQGAEKRLQEIFAVICAFVEKQQAHEGKTGEPDVNRAQ